MKISLPDSVSIAVLLLILIWWISPFWMIGMFDDGVFYACISRNLATEPGESLWDLKVGNFIDPAFNGHPPMAFWMQAIFFKIIGDHFWTERFYSILMGLFNLFLIERIWKLTVNKSVILPLFLWMLIPAVGWSYANNILENTLSVFTLSALYVIIASEKGKIGQRTSVLLASVLIFAALLTKGPPALFPLILPIIYPLVFNQQKLGRGLLISTVLSLSTFFLFALMLYFDNRAFEFFKIYYNLQIEGAFAGSNESASGLKLIFTLFQELLLPAVVIILLFLFWGKKVKMDNEQKQQAIFFLFVALSASLPLMISPKQSGFYLIPSYPFFALFLGVLGLKYFIQFKKLLSEYKKLSFVIKMILMAACFFFLVKSVLNYGKFSRNNDLLSDIFSIGQIVPKRSEVYLSPELYKNWKLHAYMYRYFYIDLSTVYENQRFAIFSKKSELQQIDSTYSENDLQFKELRLFKRAERE